MRSAAGAPNGRDLSTSVCVWNWQVLGTAGSVGLAQAPSIMSHERRTSSVATAQRGALGKPPMGL